MSAYPEEIPGAEEAARSKGSGWLRNLLPTLDHGEKQRVFRELEQVFAGQPETIRLAQAVWLTGRGQTYARRGSLFKALDCFAEAMALKRDHIPAYLSMAITYRRLGQAGGGYSYLGAAIELMKKLPRRIRVLQREVNLELFGAAVYAEWATIHILTGDRVKAVESLEKALRFYEQAQSMDEEDRRFLLQSGCRLDQEFASNLRHTLAEVRS